MSSREKSESYRACLNSSVRFFLGYIYQLGKLIAIKKWCKIQFSSQLLTESSTIDFFVAVYDPDLHLSLVVDLHSISQKEKKKDGEASSIGL